MISITPQVLKHRRTKALQEVIKNVESMIDLRNSRGFTDYTMEFTDTPEETVNYITKELADAGFSVTVAVISPLHHKAYIRWN